MSPTDPPGVPSISSGWECIFSQVLFIIPCLDAILPDSTLPSFLDVPSTNKSFPDLLPTCIDHSYSVLSAKKKKASNNWLKEDSTDVVVPSPLPSIPSDWNSFRFVRIISLFYFHIQPKARHQTMPCLQVQRIKREGTDLSIVCR